MIWMPQPFNRAPRVYCIGFSPEGPVKIGHSTNPDGRLSAMRGACPDCSRLDFLGTWPGGAELELALHRHFRDLRMDSHREWFSVAVWDVEAAIVEMSL